MFIIPEKCDLHVLDGEFGLKPISKPRGWPDVITVFMNSLTKHWHCKIIAVITSGYSDDGAAGLCGIKEVGGHYPRAETRHRRAAGYAYQRNSKRVYRFYFVT